MIRTWCSELARERHVQPSSTPEETAHSPLESHPISFVHQRGTPGHPVQSLAYHGYCIELSERETGSSRPQDVPGPSNPYHTTFRWPATNVFPFSFSTRHQCSLPLPHTSVRSLETGSNLKAHGRSFSVSRLINGFLVTQKLNTCQSNLGGDRNLCFRRCMSP